VGSTSRVLPTAFVASEIISAIGGIAAAMALGVFFGQVLPSSIKGSDEVRRRNTAVAGLIGISAMTGLILFSNGAR
jgi:hypothetical protein